jgi:hypothetical protein
MVAKGYLSPQVVEKSFQGLAPAALRSLQAPKDRILNNSGRKSIDVEITEEPVKKVSRQPSRSLSKSSVNSSKTNSNNSSAVSTAAPTESVSSSTNPYFPLRKTIKQKRLDDFYKSNWP